MTFDKWNFSCQESHSPDFKAMQLMTSHCLKHFLKVGCLWALYQQNTLTATCGVWVSGHYSLCQHHTMPSQLISVLYIISKGKYLKCVKWICNGIYFWVLGLLWKDLMLIKCWRFSIWKHCISRLFVDLQMCYCRLQVLTYIYRPHTLVQLNIFITSLHEPFINIQIFFWTETFWWMSCFFND